MKFAMQTQTDVTCKVYYAGGLEGFNNDYSLNIIEVKWLGREEGIHICG